MGEIVEIETGRELKLGWRDVSSLGYPNDSATPVCGVRRLPIGGAAWFYAADVTRMLDGLPLSGLVPGECVTVTVEFTKRDRRQVEVISPRAIERLAARRPGPRAAWLVEWARCSYPRTQQPE
jgi:hypothetical protein